MTIHPEDAMSYADQLHRDCAAIADELRGIGETLDKLADMACGCVTFREPTAASTLPAAYKLADLLAAEFTLRRVLDEDEASSAVLALKEAGFVLIAPQRLAEAALVQEGLRLE